MFVVDNYVVNYFYFVDLLFLNQFLMIEESRKERRKRVMRSLG